MTRAEEAALKAYPAHNGASEQWKKAHLSSLSEYIQGYEQAEKDTIERALTWLKEKYWLYGDVSGHDLEDLLDAFKESMEEEL